MTSIAFCRLGRHQRICITEGGVQYTRSIRRLPGNEKYDVDFIEQIGHALVINKDHQIVVYALCLKLALSDHNVDTLRYRIITPACLIILRFYVHRRNLIPSCSIIGFDIFYHPARLIHPACLIHPLLLHSNS